MKARAKKLASILLAGTMALGLAACSSSSSDSGTDEATGGTEETTGGTETSTAEAEESSSSSSGESVTLNFSMHSAEDSTNGVMFREVFDEMNEASGGGLNIDIFGSALLASSSEVADMVKQGGCDMGWIFTSFYTGQYPLTDVISIPLLGAQTSEQGTNVLWDLYENYPEMADEWSDYKVLFLYANPVSYIYSNSEVTTLDDISGLTIRSTSGATADCLSSWGANVVTMAPNDVYDGMSKGTINSYTAEPTMLIDYSWTEITDYKNMVPLYQAAFVVAINKETYEGLPEEYKEVIDSYATREHSLDLAKQIDEYVEECDQEFTDAGGQIVELTDAQLADLQPAVDEWVAQWVTDNTTADFDAQEYYDFCVSAYESYAE